MRYLSRPEVLKLVTVSDGTLRFLIANEGFPRPRQISPHRVGFLDDDVYAWMAARPETVEGREQPEQLRVVAESGA